MRVGVDADILNYRCCFAAEPCVYHIMKGKHKLISKQYRSEIDKEFKALPEETQLECEIEKEVDLQPWSTAKDSVDSLIGFIKKRLGTRHLDYFLTSADRSNFRFELATILPYKENRQDQKKPHYYQDMRDYLIDHYQANVIEGEEADDALAQYQWASYRHLISHEMSDVDLTCIASLDKDLMMVPGYHYDFVKDEFKYVTLIQGIRTFYKQLLTGDKSTDNIPGLYQVTAKRCTAPVLNKLDTMGDPTEMCKYVKQVYAQGYTQMVDKQVKDGIDEREISIYTEEEIADHIDKVVYEIGNLLYMRPKRGKWWTPGYNLTEDL